MKSAPRAVVVVIAASLVGALGCASGRADTRVLPDDLATLRLEDDAEDAGLGLPTRLPAPDTAAEAQMYLQGSVAALRAEEPLHAALFLEAILRSDHLTDRGRANVYWLLGEARRQTGDDARLVDAMSGFLVATSLLGEEPDFLERAAQARVTLTAARVRLSPVLGSSPARPIRVAVANDAAQVVEHLGCGPHRDMPYVERGVELSVKEPRVLEARTLTCTDDGKSVTLWFDVTEVE